MVGDEKAYISKWKCSRSWMFKLCINEWISWTRWRGRIRDQILSRTPKGLIILASKRHIKCFDELTEEEQIDYICVLSKIRKAQRKVLGIEYVYYFYNEDTTHHFHTWLVPRYEWMYEFGRSVESVRPVLLYARNQMNDEENMSEVISAIKKLKIELNW